MINCFAGIDVQISRGCAYYILDADKKHIKSGWVKENISQSFNKIFLENDYFYAFESNNIMPVQM